MESEDYPLLETALDPAPIQPYTRRTGQAHGIKDLLLHYPWVSAYIVVIHLLLGLIAFLFASGSRPRLDPYPFGKFVQT
jgi:hypothetical protein